MPLCTRHNNPLLKNHCTSVPYRICEEEERVDVLLYDSLPSVRSIFQNPNQTEQRITSCISTRKDKDGNHRGESQVNELANDDHIVEKVRSLKCVLFALAVS